MGKSASRRRLLGLRWRRWGIRRQLTVAGIVAVTGPFLIGILILASLLHTTLTRTLQEDVDAECRRLAAVVQDDGPHVVERADQLDDGYRAQVLFADTGQVAATWNPRFATPLSPLRPAPGETVTAGAAAVWLPGASDGDVVVASGVRYEDRDYVVLVTASQQGQDLAVDTMVRLLLAAVPLLMLLTGLGAYWLVRRALRPVEEITRRVEGITATRLTERVPVPAARDEIGTLATTMNSMLARLEASQAAQVRFVSDASHELRSPLTTLSGALEIGRSSHDERTWAELEPLMTTETGRLGRLVDDLLLLSRAADGGLRLTLRDVDLDDLVDAEKRRLRDSGSIQVVSHVTAARVVGDRDKLLMALRNLDDNALRHARSRVSLTVAPLAGGGARIEVADDGAGIAEADRARVFERFVRLDESRSRDSGGSGLGLSIVANVVAAHGGTVRVDEASEGGARFFVELPARPPGSYPPAASRR